MKSKKMFVVSIISMIILILSIGHVDAANASFNITVDPEEVSAKKGDTITIDLGITDIDQSTDGINAVEGKLTYDEGLFESVDIVSAGNNWSTEYNQEEGNPKKGTFVLNNLSSVKNSSVVAKIKAKIKSNATVDTGKLYLEDVCSSYDGKETTQKVNKTITVNVLKQNDNPPSEDNQTPTPSTPSGSDSTGSSTQGTTQTPNKTQKPASNLPKAGLNSWISVAIIVCVIGAIVGFVRYKKIY